MLTGTLTFLATAFLVSATFIIGPELEDRINPVYENLTTKIVAVTDAHTDLLITGKKMRACALAGLGANVKIGKTEFRGVVTFVESDRSPLTLPQLATGDTFVRLVRVRPAGDAIKLLVDNACHPFWVTRTVIDLTNTVR